MPVTALRVMHETDTSDDPEPFGGPGPADAGAMEVAQRIYEALVSDGRSPAAARERLRTMPPSTRCRASGTGEAVVSVRA